MKETERKAGKLAGDLAALAARTQASEKQILESARSRQDTARQERDQMRQAALLDDGSQRHYQALTLEIGRLDRVIAQSLHHLAAVS